MAGQILVLNAGSSTIKFKIFTASTLTPLVSGLVELSQHKGRVAFKVGSKSVKEENLALVDHQSGLGEVVRQLTKHGVLEDRSNIIAVGHRVAHGGENFQEATRITDDVKKAIQKACSLAPLHNPANLVGINVAEQIFPSDLQQVAVFDTAFHQTLTAEKFLYAIPYKYYTQQNVRKYGFHGTSHQYVAQKAHNYLNKQTNGNFITCHLGNGSSLCCIRNHVSVDTTMGMTPLEGLVMGTRCGDIDAAVPFHLMRVDDLSPHDMENMLNKKSGLLGLTNGLSKDVRTLQESIFSSTEDQAAKDQSKLALEVMAHRIRRYLGAYLLELDGAVDAIVFTAGIGENSSYLRHLVLSNLGSFNIEVDAGKNELAKGGKEIAAIHSTKNMKNIPILVIPTDEEKSIAEQTFRCIQN